MLRSTRRPAQLQEPCINGFVASRSTTPTLLQLDGNLGRNAGVTPWTVFDDMRVSKRIISPNASAWT